VRGVPAVQREVEVLLGGEILSDLPESAGGLNSRHDHAKASRRQRHTAGAAAHVEHLLARPQRGGLDNFVRRRQELSSRQFVLTEAPVHGHHGLSLSVVVLVRSLCTMARYHFPPASSQRDSPPCRPGPATGSAKSARRPPVGKTCSLVNLPHSEEVPSIVAGVYLGQDARSRCAAQSGRGFRRSPDDRFEEALE